MNKRFRWNSWALACILASSLVGCMGPSYVPASYGTKALKEKIADPKASVVDAVAAATALADRNLAEQDARDIFDLLAQNRHPRINVALLRTIQKKNMALLAGDLLKNNSEIKDPDTAVEMMTTLLQFLEGNPRIRFVAEQILKSPFAEVRARAVRALAGDYADKAEIVFVKALEKESNAVVAYEMCTALLKVGTEKSLPILDDISNTPERIFKADNLFGSPADANLVRTTAIQAYETISATYGE